VVKFDFSKHNTKLIYAGAKFLIAIIIGIQYIGYVKILGPSITTKSGKLLGLFPLLKTKSKSLLTLIVLAILSIYRDKFEKKISSAYEPGKLHFGRAMLTPLIYVSFTLMMMLE